MRCFIAIDIDENNRAALGDLQQQLQSKVDVKRSDVKWVNPENVHLTLKFLGEIKDEQVVDICNIVKEVAGRHDSFAGALMGSLAQKGKTDFESLKTAIAYGTVVASFTIADFSLEGLTSINKTDIDNRLETLRNLTQF